MASSHNLNTRPKQGQARPHINETITVRRTLAAEIRRAVLREDLSSTMPEHLKQLGLGTLRGLHPEPPDVVPDQAIFQLISASHDIPRYSCAFNFEGT